MHYISNLVFFFLKIQFSPIPNQPIMAVSFWLAILLLILGCSSLKALGEKQVREMLNLERNLLQNMRDYAEKLEEKIDLINKCV